MNVDDISLVAINLILHTDCFFFINKHVNDSYYVYCIQKIR